MEQQRQSILNVDDYEPARYARTTILRHAGFDVIEASRGLEALDLVSKHKPSIVLLDINMPDMSGFEVCAQIRKNPITATTTIVHISGSSTQPQQQIHGLEAGADSYLVEPVDPGVLIATLKALLRARDAEDALRRSNADLERFAYMVAHDLREPLRTVSSYGQLLTRRLGPGIDPGVSQCLDFMIGGASRMSMLIDDILKYSQAANSRGPLIPTDCQSSLGQALTSLKSAVEASGAECTSEAMPVVFADERIEHVFQNLISNAIKYRREDVPLKIHIGVIPEGDHWLFWVQDNGIGIAPKYKERIFDIFRRLHGHDIPGTGIGLALCQRIVEDYGGAIWVESELGFGSKFCFTLPSAKPISVMRVPG